MKRYFFFAVITAFVLSSCSASKNTYIPTKKSKLFVIGTGDACLKNVKTGERAKRHSRYN